MRRPGNSRLVYSTGGETPKEETSAEAKNSSSPGIRLRLEGRAGNRVVTVVSGLPGKADKQAALARSLKSSCSTGGSFKDGLLELQGDHREKVEELLAALGLRSKRAGG